MFVRLFGVIYYPQNGEVTNPVNGTELNDIFQLSRDSANNSNAARDLQGELRKFFTSHVPKDIPSYQRKLFLELLMKTSAWPSADANPISYPDVGKTKDQLMDVIGTLNNGNNRLNAYLHCLCKDTFLGSVFHTKRNIKTPSVNSGRLNTIAQKLEELIQIMGTETLRISDDTKRALIAEKDRNPEFAASLKAFPNLYNAIEAFIVPDARIEVVPPGNDTKSNNEYLTRGLAL